MISQRISYNTHNIFMKIFYGKCSNTFVSQCIRTCGIVSLKWLIDGLYIIAP